MGFRSRHEPDPDVAAGGGTVRNHYIAQLFGALVMSVLTA